MSGDWQGRPGSRTPAAPACRPGGFLEDPPARGQDWDTDGIPVARWAPRVPCSVIGKCYPGTPSPPLPLGAVCRGGVPSVEKSNKKLICQRRGHSACCGCRQHCPSSSCPPGRAGRAGLPDVCRGAAAWAFAGLTCAHSMPSTECQAMRRWRGWASAAVLYPHPPPAPPHPHPRACALTPCLLVCQLCGNQGPAPCGCPALSICLLPGQLQGL